jgi:hypothetical protein
LILLQVFSDKILLAKWSTIIEKLHFSGSCIISILN